MKNTSRRAFVRTGGAVAVGAAASWIGPRRTRSAETGAKRYRAAIIGRTGRGNYGHGLDVVYNHFDNIEVVAVADEDAGGRKKAAERTGAKGQYTDYRMMLAREKPDIVSVAPRWLDCHHDMVLACAEAGAHVFLEKPMARTLAEADAMIEACESRGLKMVIAHQMRLSPVITEVRKRIAAGAIGQLMDLRGRGKEDRRAGGEDIMVLGTHILDLMRLLAGDARWVQAEVKTDGRRIGAGDVRDGNEGIGPLAGDTITATYGFDNNVHGFFASKKNADGGGGRYGLHVYGSKGMMTMQGGGDPIVHLLASSRWAPTDQAATWQRVVSVTPSDVPDADGLLAGNVRIVRDWLDAIEQDRRPLSSGHDGRAALEMILSVYEAHRQDTRVRLPLERRTHPLEALRQGSS
jgi:predicted dehydrogenase